MNSTEIRSARFRMWFSPVFLAWVLGSPPVFPATSGGARLTLQQAIELAWERNPDIHAAEARLGQAQASVEEATAAFYPRLTARVGYDYSDNPALAFSYVVAQRRFNFGMNINHPGYVENFRPEVFTTWSIFRGGQDYYRKKAAELGVEVAELEHSALRNQLAAAVTAAYYALLEAPRQVEVSKKSVEAVTSELEHTRHRHQAGSSLKSDVLSLEVRLAQSRENETHALNSVELARAAIKTLLGGETVASLEAVEPAANGAAGRERMEKVLAQALSQRPEMQAATSQVTLRQHELDMERGARLPRVNAFAAYGQNSRTPGFSTEQGNVTLGVSAELDLYAGGAVTARISAAEKRLAEAQALETRTRLEIEEEVRKAYLQLEEALSRKDAAEAGAKSAEEALRLVHEQYREGAATVTRYLEAEADRAQAQTRAIAARYAVEVAEANLKKASGFWR
ncbi:TolC family protein [Methylococcus capsulatus]|jgi:outer membrane protein|uniref:TolC family protein n=1 Tax=Methylococcus capsulatus TaxID=414 RepID=UPI00035F7521